MCYDIKASLESQLNRARRKGDEQAVREIIEKLAPLSDLPLYHVTGFQHPKLFIYPDRSPDLPELAIWGLVPHWVKDREQLKKYWNNTLNARGETIFEKPSFRNSARHHRCLVYVDGFYEHHHYKGKTYPFYVFQKDNQPLSLAGLWSEWVDESTGEIINSFSIVTTAANRLMGKIHNNPKLKSPRMPLILPQVIEEDWLKPIEEEPDEKAIRDLITAYPDDELKAFSVNRLRGTSYVGNIKEVCEEVAYPELQVSPVD